MFKLLFLFYIFMVVLSTNIVRCRESESYPAIDAVIQGLNEEIWDEKEAPCREATLELLRSVKNFTLWATWVWDANKFPSGSLYGSWIQLSNFDQCMKPPWLDTHPQFKTQYCLAEVQIAHKELKNRIFDPYESTEVFLKTNEKIGLRNNQFVWGICVLASCQPHSITKIVRQMYLSTHFKAISQPNITVDYCQEAGTKEELTTGYYLFFCLIATLFTISLGSTYYRTCMKNPPATANSLGAVVLESFCMIKNSAELTKSQKNEIKVLNGIRFITATQVVLLHVVVFTMTSGSVNARDLELEIDYVGKVLNMSVVVDTFFAISGLLHIKGLLSKKQQNLFIVLWKRYVRLTPLFALAIFYYISVIKFHGSGPFWHNFYDRECSLCQNNWLLSLLMINTSMHTLCHSISWYIACDYQLTIFATVLFFIHEKKKRLAIHIFGLAAVMSLVIPGFLTYWHKINPVFFLNIEDILNIRNNEHMDYTYFKSYSRAGPYLAGVAMGYLMHIYKPVDHRRSLSTLYSVVGFMLSLLFMTSSFCLGHFFLHREYDAVEAGIAAALYRTVWGVAGCAIVGFCEYGNVPFVTAFFSIPFFRPLGKLAYGLFLVHLLVLLQTNKVFTIRSPPAFDMFAVIIDTVGITVVSLGISYILWLILEAPLINLSEHFICKRFDRRRVDQSGAEENNEMEQQRIKLKAT